MLYESNSFIPESMPVEIEPVYRTNVVNEPVSLYCGSVEFVEDGKSVTGDGSIQIEWLPVPRLMFYAKLPKWSPSPGPARLPIGLLRVADGRSVKVQTTSLSYGLGEVASVPSLSGEAESAEFGCGDSIANVKFHIPNFRAYLGENIRDETGSRASRSRAEMESDEWRITIDQLHVHTNENGKKLEETIKASGGFGITHVAKLERRGGGTFSSADVADVQSALRWFISFCRGSWTALLLPVGFDANDTRVWEEWREWKVERWRRVPSWFHWYLHGPAFAGVFPGFMQRWTNKIWKEPIELAIHWYIESNMCAGGVEGGIILAQAAFELLAWTLLVDDHQVLSEQAFQPGKLQASDKLRLLLASCRIPLAIPSDLCELTKAAAANNWTDGPQAIVEIRNALVHANPTKRAKVLGGSNDARVEAWTLSQWYLELVLLWLFHYQGNYFDRCDNNPLPGLRAKKVPWA